MFEIKSSVCMSKSQRNLCLSFSRIDVELSVYHLFVWSNFNFLNDIIIIIIIINIIIIIIIIIKNNYQFNAKPNS